MEIFNTQLTKAMENFVSIMLPLSEKDLEREWKWKDHDEEGIRFAFFVTLQELRQLAVTLSTPSTSLRTTPAQHILSQYHAAYMDLQAALLGLSNGEAEKAPAEGEWSVRRAYTHILGTDIGFSEVVRHALEGHRAGTWKPDQMSDEDEARVARVSEDEYQKMMSDPLDNMLTFHRKVHTEIIQEFSTITDTELDLPSTFWEETRFPIRHRLHRFEAHLVQHTIQIDKTLVAIGQAPDEAKRLLRKVYAALAEAEGMMIGAEKMDDRAILATASSIMERTKEIEGLIREN